MFPIGRQIGECCIGKLCLFIMRIIPNTQIVCGQSAVVNNISITELEHIVDGAGGVRFSSNIGPPPHPSGNISPDLHKLNQTCACTCNKTDGVSMVCVTHTNK